MPESMTTRLMRWGFNLMPCYRGSGGRVTYISSDWMEIHVKLRLNWRTRNYVGTIFGGSIYGAIDPMYMLILIKTLGPDYVVWDKAAAIRFRKPGTGTLFARFHIDAAELETIRAAAAGAPSVDRVYRVELTDASGVVYASVDKTLYIRHKGAPRPTRTVAAQEVAPGAGNYRSEGRTAEEGVSEAS